MFQFSCAIWPAGSHEDHCTVPRLEMREQSLSRLGLGSSLQGSCEVVRSRSNASAADKTYFHETADELLEGWERP